MNLRNYPFQLASLLALSELVSALLLPGAYTFPFRYGFRLHNWYEPIILLGMALQVLFVLVPAVAMVGLFRARVGAFWLLYMSPVLSFLLGVSSVPFIAYAVPAGDPRTVLLVVTNLAAIAAAIWLRRRVNEIRSVVNQPLVAK